MDAQLQETVARYVLGQLFVDNLPRIATDALLRGIESPSLVVLAGATRADAPSDLRELFEAALRELRVPMPSRLDAAELLKRRHAQDVLDEILSPREGARLIVDLYYAIDDQVQSVRFAADGFGIAHLYGNFYSFDDIQPDDSTAEREIEAALRDNCAKIVTSGRDDANDACAT